jgi:hypothetical protein
LSGNFGAESISGGGGGAGGTAIGYFAVTESSYAVTVGAGGSAGVGAVQVEQAEPQSLTALADWAEMVVRNQGSLRWLAGKAVFLLVARLTFPEVTALIKWLPDYPRQWWIIILGRRWSWRRTRGGGDCYGSGGGAYDAAMSGNYNGGQGKAGIVYIEEYS